MIAVLSMEGQIKKVFQGAEVRHFGSMVPIRHISQIQITRENTILGVGYIQHQLDSLAVLRARRMKKPNSRGELRLRLYRIKLKL